MTIGSGDIKFYKSQVVGNDPLTNGGLTSISKTAAGTTLFSDVSGLARAAGDTYFRKVFLWNEKNDGGQYGYFSETLGSVRAYLQNPSPAADNFMLLAPTAQDDVEDDLSGLTGWASVGILNANVAGGGTVGAVQVLAEVAGEGFNNSGEIVIRQIDDSGVETKELLTITSRSWNSNICTVNFSPNLVNAYVRAATYGVIDSVGTTTLTKSGAFAGKNVVGRLVRIKDGDGAGELRRVVSHTDSELTINYAWTPGKTPVGGVDSFEIVNTYVSQVVSLGNAAPTIGTFGGTGTYSTNDGPPKVMPIGTPDDSFTITFGANNSYSCSGIRVGACGSGTLGSPNPIRGIASGRYLWELPFAGFTGFPYANGKTITFVTTSSSRGLWVRQTFAPGIDPHAGNRVDIGFLGETS